MKQIIFIGRVIRIFPFQKGIDVGEINPLADVGLVVAPVGVNDARDNAKNNGLAKARFIAADCTKYMLEASEKGEKYDVVFLDPPRAGTTATC